jgi:hypothetical protein
MTDFSSSFIVISALQVVDRWHPKVSKRPPRAHDMLYCGWCNEQLNRRDAGKKSRPLEQCPWANSNWTPPPPPSQTIPAAERWHLLRVIPNGRRRYPDITHLGYFPTREAAEAHKASIEGV